MGSSWDGIRVLLYRKERDDELIVRLETFANTLKHSKAWLPRWTHYIQAVADDDSKHIKYTTLMSVSNDVSFGDLERIANELQDIFKTTSKWPDPKLFLREGCLAELGERLADAMLQKLRLTKQEGRKLGIETEACGPQPGIQAHRPSPSTRTPRMTRQINGAKSIRG